MPLLGRENLNAKIGGLVSVANDDLRGVIFNGFSLIQKGTPVDEGRARNNWFVTVDAPSNRTTTATTGNEINLSRIPKTVLGKTMFLTNNMPYITTLEYGHSNQAPNGWVRKAVILMQNKIRAL